MKITLWHIYATLFIYIGSVILKNSSLYDPFWSVAPVPIVIYLAINSDNSMLLKILVTFPIIFWAARLTRNWLISWKGFEHEDFRYIDLKNTNLYKAEFNNFFGIHLFPTLIVNICLYPLVFIFLNPIEVTPFLVEAVGASIPGTEKFYQYNKFPDSGAWHFVKRLTVTNLGAWSFKEVSEYGYWDRNFFEDVASSVIPRILWPEKPNFWPGRIFAAKVGHAYDAESATTATALGMAASYYWWGGLPALIIGMFFSGCILSMVFRLIQPSISNNPVSTIIWLILLNTSLFWFESSFYGGAQMFIYLAVAFLPVMFLYQTLFIKNRIQ